MNRALLVIAALVLTAGAAGAGDDAPEKAICRACEIRGAGHGPEKVAASRRYEGRDYHFCSKQCAEAFDAFPDGYAVHPVPRPAPEAIVTTMEGDRLTLGGPGDRAVLLDFWATWCVPCKKAMPEIEDLQRDYGPRGLAIVGVSIDEDTKAVEKFLRKKRLSYTVALDSHDAPAWHAYFVAVIPAMILIDREGRIVGEWRGRIDLDTVRDRIDAVLGEVPPADEHGAGTAEEG